MSELPTRPFDYSNLSPRHEHGLSDPEQVVKATSSFRAESDALGRFLDACCMVGSHYNVGSSDLFAAWSKWCAAEGADPGTQTAFATALQNKGLDSRKVHGRMRWTGVGLATEGDE